MQRSSRSILVPVARVIADMAAPGMSDARSLLHGKALAPVM